MCLPDGVGNSNVVDGEKYCLDVALGGNLEVWTAPLIDGAVAQSFGWSDWPNTTILARCLASAVQLFSLN